MRSLKVNGAACVHVSACSDQINKSVKIIVHLNNNSEDCWAAFIKLVCVCVWDSLARSNVQPRSWMWKVIYTNEGRERDRWSERERPKRAAAVATKNGMHCVCSVINQKAKQWTTNSSKWTNRNGNRHGHKTRQNAINSFDSRVGPNIIMSHDPTTNLNIV